MCWLSSCHLNGNATARSEDPRVQKRLLVPLVLTIYGKDDRINGVRRVALDASDFIRTTWAPCPDQTDLVNDNVLYHAQHFVLCTAQRTPSNSCPVKFSSTYSNSRWERPYDGQSETSGRASYVCQNIHATSIRSSRFSTSSKTLLRKAVSAKLRSRFASLRSDPHSIPAHKNALHTSAGYAYSKAQQNLSRKKTEFSIVRPAMRSSRDNAPRGNEATVEPLRHRQTKGAANRHAQPKVTAPHSYSTQSFPSHDHREGLQRAESGPSAIAMRWQECAQRHCRDTPFGSWPNGGSGSADSGLPQAKILCTDQLVPTTPRLSYVKPPEPL